MRFAVCCLWLGLGAGCGDNEPPVEAAPAVDPKFQLDALSGKWIRVDGRKGDHTHRFEWFRAGSTTELWYTNGGFTKRRMVGELRASDWKFTEQLSASDEAQWKAGNRTLARLYVVPRPEAGGLRVTEFEVGWKDGKEVEKAKGTFQEYVSFPASVDFSFRPCDGPLFLGKAATDPTLAARQLAETGAPHPATTLGEAIAVGVWTDTAADGEASCTYDMDLYFDDRPAENGDGSKRMAVGANTVRDGKRFWGVEDWYAPYSGNHHLQVFRYRTCAGSERTLLGVQCLESILE